MLAGFAFEMGNGTGIGLMEVGFGAWVGDEARPEGVVILTLLVHHIELLRNLHAPFVLLTQALIDMCSVVRG